MNTTEEGIRNNIPSKEEIAGRMNIMKNEVAETLQEFKKNCATHQYAQNGGAQNAQWGGSSSSTSILEKWRPKENKKPDEEAKKEEQRKQENKRQFSKTSREKKRQNCKNYA
jgi:hypothetical protein